MKPCDRCGFIGCVCDTHFFGPTGQPKDLAYATRLALLLPPLENPKKVFKTILPFTPFYISGDSTVVEMIRPDLTVRPLRLVIAPSCAPFFSVIDVKVAHMSVFAGGPGRASAQAFPPSPYDTKDWLHVPETSEHDRKRAKFFRELADGLPAEFFPALPGTTEQIRRAEEFQALGFPTCSPAQCISLVVRNDTSDRHILQALLWVVAVEP